MRTSVSGLQSTAHRVSSRRAFVASLRSRPRSVFRMALELDKQDDQCYLQRRYAKRHQHHLRGHSDTISSLQDCSGDKSGDLPHPRWSETPFPITVAWALAWPWRGTATWISTGCSEKRTTAAPRVAWAEARGEHLPVCRSPATAAGHRPAGKGGCVGEIRSALLAAEERMDQKDAEGGALEMMPKSGTGKRGPAYPATRKDPILRLPTAG